MKYLESINLVQFFLYEREHVRIDEITGIFGPNGSGKSSFLDAVQIAMFGANSRLMALNAQADENKTTRSIRTYCLGQYGDTPEDRVRPHSNTYITLVWRDSETHKPVSMGVCIYASKDREQHDVLGRYLLPDVELTLGDHLETVDGKEKPREWNAFKQQLLQRSKVSGEECVFQEAERYIRACLLELRGSGGTPSYEAFVRAFRFALRMRFDKTVDEIVRNDVLEARPTNIKKFKDVTDSFRRLAELVAHVEQKIIDGSAVENAFDNAAKASRKAATWKTLGLDVVLTQANQAHDDAQEAMEDARTAFEGAPYSAFSASSVIGLAGIPKMVMTIENQTTFHSEAKRRHDEEVLLIYTAGMPTPAWRAMYVRLLGGLPPGVPVYHWGDIDEGGFRIASILAQDARSAGHTLQPWMMHPDDVPEDRRVKARPHTLERIRRFSSAAGWGTLGEEIAKAGFTAEQEGLSIVGLAQPQ